MVLEESDDRNTKDNGRIKKIRTGNYLFVA